MRINLLRHSGIIVYTLPTMTVIEQGRIISNIAIAENLYYIRIELPEIAADAKPGNFISLLPPHGSGKYLRKPFSIASSKNGIIGLVLKNTGRATDAFSKFKPGEIADALGPLGNSYPEELKAGKNNIWMLGGGTGVASLLFLNSYRKSGRECNNADLLLWAGKKASALPSAVLNDLDEIYDSCIIYSTDDGSFGEKGSASGLLEEWLTNNRPDAITACGPHRMLRAVRELSIRHRIPAWLSLEEFMACGVGACAGCVSPDTAGGHKNVCSDGPVFRAEEVVI